MTQLSMPPNFLQPGSHVCHLFDGSNEQKAVTLAFVLEGLEQGEACLFTPGRQSVDDWLFEFQACGIDVGKAREKRALEVISGAEYRRPDGFNSMVKAGELLRFVRSRLVDFPSIRIIGDVAWELDPPLPADKLCHWEATANLVFQDLPVRAICQYDYRADSPATIHSALRTHPFVILKQQLYRNPFYEAPRILENEPRLNHSDADALRIEEMIEQIASSPHHLIA